MKHILLIDLDALLDTRLGTIEKLNPQAAEECIENGFTKRAVDDVELFTDKITNGEYKEAYSKRDVETLKRSRLTNMIFPLSDMIKQMDLNIMQEQGVISDGCVVINHYPYKLTKEEASTIRNSVMDYIGGGIKVHMAEFPYDQLNIQEMKRKDIRTFITYNSEQWFNEVLVNAPKSSIIANPQMDVIIPKMVIRKDAMDQFTKRDIELMGSNDIFDTMRLVMAPMFGVEFFPIEFFSMYDPSIFKD